ncbi:short-chain fatty acyl-CoA regulator family protein [Novosphingobium sp. 9]|uniref:helix-turn-helix domain-containing protein n=1 Tax=Novosphingobium sp. 9 TaxID=2025349 RepID=UPI0021B6914D|nr:helix-turn-helix transcriptional regulator [Novosphingobium sp. 9]
MARKSIYMGPRLKRVRRDLGLTQADMAEGLEISASYVALMERNQRPVTAELLLKLAANYRIDIADLVDGGTDEASARLQAVLKEPMFADIDLPALDVEDIATSYPGFAEALLRLHTSYREEQLALAARREGEGEGGAAPASDPVAESRAFLASRRNCFPAIDDHATEVAQETPGIEALVARLEQRHRLTVRFVDPATIMGARRWHDAHRGQLFVSHLLDASARRFQLAIQLALLEATPVITAALREGTFSNANARVMTRRALVNYWAGAFAMPYRTFLRAARRTRCDLEALGREFGASFEQVAHRLTTLQKPGEEGVPFFFVRVDAAGNVTKRLDGAGFPFAHHGGGCPLWNVHESFAEPARVRAQRIELPDGQRFVSIARTVEAGGGSYETPRLRRAVALACAEEHLDRLVYADALTGAAPTPIGVACRLCHRPHCIARSAPPIGRELRSDKYRESGVPFAFASD